MKKYAYLSLACALTCFSSFVAAGDFPINAKFASSEDVKIVHLQDLTDEKLKEVVEEKHPELAVEFAEGTCLPISFYLRGDLVHLIGNDELRNEKSFGAIEVKQTFYARYVEGEFMLSFDGTKWAPFLEFVTGTSSAGLAMQEDRKPFILIGAEINRRL